MGKTFTYSTMKGKDRACRIVMKVANEPAENKH